MKSLKILFFTAVFVFSSPASFAQVSKMNGFRRGFAIVAFAGIGGAVLGLSTLSFYGNPQDHVGNITTGFVLGLAGGMAYLAADVSQNSRGSVNEALWFEKLNRGNMGLRPKLQIPIYLAEF
jgi:hypothetical protein